MIWTFTVPTKSVAGKANSVAFRYAQQEGVIYGNQRDAEIEQVMGPNSTIPSLSGNTNRTYPNPTSGTATCRLRTNSSTSGRNRTPAPDCSGPSALAKDCPWHAGRNYVPTITSYPAKRAGLENGDAGSPLKPALYAAMGP